MMRSGLASRKIAVHGRGRLSKRPPGVQVKMARTKQENPIPGGLAATAVFKFVLWLFTITRERPLRIRF